MTVSGRGLSECPFFPDRTLNILHTADQSFKDILRVNFGNSPEKISIIDKLAGAFHDRFSGELAALCVTCSSGCQESEPITMHRSDYFGRILIHLLKENLRILSTTLIAHSVPHFEDVLPRVLFLHFLELVRAIMGEDSVCFYDFTFHTIISPLLEQDMSWEAIYNHDSVRKYMYKMLEELRASLESHNYSRDMFIVRMNNHPDIRTSFLFGEKNYEWLLKALHCPEKVI